VDNLRYSLYSPQPDGCPWGINIPAGAVSGAKMYIKNGGKQMRSRYVLGVIVLVLPMILAITFVGQVRSSPSIGDVYTPVIHNKNTIPIPRNSSPFKRAQRHHRNIRLACFAGALDACDYDDDCCHGGRCYQLSVCAGNEANGYCCFP